MKRFISWTFVAILFSFNLSTYVYDNFYKPLHSTDETKKEAVKLKEFTIKAMNLAPSVKFSDSKKNILADKIVNLVMKNIKDKSAQETYISMLKIESNFDNSAKSNMNAIGIGQILTSTFKNAAKECGISVNQEDIYNEDLNIIVGSCYFNSLLKDNDNNPRLASISYNGGPRTTEKFKKLTNINIESSNYALRAEHVKELASK